MNKMGILIISIFICFLTTMNISTAAGLSTYTAVKTPFRWIAGGTTFSGETGYQNGTEVVPGSLNYKGTTYIPIRLAAEALGLTVHWDAANSTATLIDSESEDDPVSDVPGKYPNASFTVSSTIKKSSILYSKASEVGAATARLAAGQKIVVLDEAADGWMKVIAKSSIGYVRIDATDYVPRSERPLWEQTADSIIEAGLAFLGAPYEFDADLGQTRTFDCSSYVNYLYEMHDIDLPRNSRQQSRLGTTVAYEEVRKGDLLFFTTPKRSDNTGSDRIGHVAIYIGDGKLLHTFRTGIGVTVTQLDDNWKKRLITAKRILP